MDFPQDPIPHMEPISHMESRGEQDPTLPPSAGTLQPEQRAGVFSGGKGAGIRVLHRFPPRPSVGASVP